MADTKPTIPTGSASVIVKNIAPTVDPPTHKVLTDFFSFCGTIAALSINPVDDRTVSAIVTFETEGAAKTAVLLNNALINDRAITVEMAPSGFVPPSSGAPSDQQQHSASEPRSEASVIQALMDSGYKLGSDALTTAKSWDEQAGISQSLSVGIAAIGSKMDEIDQSWQISNKVKGFGDSVGAKVAEVNQEYQISAKASEVSGQAANFLSETATSIASGASTAAGSVVNFVNTNPQVAQGISTVQAVGSAIGQTLSDTIGSLFAAAPAPTDGQNQ